MQATTAPTRPATWKERFRQTIRTVGHLPTKNALSTEELNARAYLRARNKKNRLPAPTEQELKDYWFQTNQRGALEAEATHRDNALRGLETRRVLQGIPPAQAPVTDWIDDTTGSPALRCKDATHRHPWDCRRLQDIPRRHWRALEVRLNSLTKIYHLTPDQSALHLDLHPEDHPTLRDAIADPDFRD
jgi:hypothetical protein